jgi:hypothetical protein
MRSDASQRLAAPNRSERRSLASFKSPSWPEHTARRSRRSAGVASVGESPELGRPRDRLSLRTPSLPRRRRRRARSHPAYREARPAHTHNRQQRNRRLRRLTPWLQRHLATLLAQVDPDDLAAPDRHGGDRERLPVERGDHPVTPLRGAAPRRLPPQASAHPPRGAHPRTRCRGACGHPRSSARSDAVR